MFELVLHEELPFGRADLHFKGGGGGGSTSDYPEYLKSVHSRWLDLAGQERVTHSVSYYMSRLFDASPHDQYYITLVDSIFGQSPATVFSMLNNVIEVDVLSSFDNVWKTVANSEAKTNILTTHLSNLNDDMDETVMPRFKAGMRDINSAMSSTYVLGAALLETKKVKAYNDYVAKVDMHIFDMSRDILAKYLDWEKTVVTMGVEVNRIFIAGRFDENKFNMDANVKDLTWDLEIWEYGANVMAAIAGASTVRRSSQTDNGNALGGALSGAAMGMAMTGGNPIGGVVGGLAGLFM